MKTLEKKMKTFEENLTNNEGSEDLNVNMI